MRSIVDWFNEASMLPPPSLPQPPHRYWDRNKLPVPGSPRHKHYRENARRLKQMERQT